MVRPYARDRRSPDRIPEGYETLGTSSARAVVWSGAGGWLDSVLRSGVTVYNWAATQERHEEFTGRGRVFSVPAPVAGPDERNRWAVRRFHRGGAMAMHLGDRYLRFGRDRPSRELAASVAARARGILTPAVVCATTYPQGVYYRGDLITEIVPNARTLADTLLEHEGTRGWLIAMAQAGALIHQLTESGVYHVDLNAHNILLAGGPEGAAFVIDFDRVRILRSPLPAIRHKMQVRLTRSIVKIGTPTGEHLKDSEILAALDRPPHRL